MDEFDKVKDAVSELEVSIAKLGHNVKGLLKLVKFVFWLYVLIAVLSGVLWISMAYAQEEKQSECMLWLEAPVDGQTQHPCVLSKPRKCWICPPDPEPSMADVFEDLACILDALRATLDGEEPKSCEE